MAEKLTLLHIDAVTGIETVRELTASEIAEHNALQAGYEAKEAEQKAKIDARQSALAKLAALGLTEAEIAAL
jgi:DNA-binding NarL/FixJ family response regulator